MSSDGFFPIDNWTFHSGAVVANLSAEERECLFMNAEDRRCKKGEIIFRSGELAKGVYFIRRGKVKKYISDKYGYKQIIYVAGAGELIGYHAVMSDEGYPDTTETMEDSVLSFIPRADFLCALESSHSLTRLMIEALSHEYKVLSNCISIFAKHSSRERLAIILVVLQEKYKTADLENGGIVGINVSRKDLGSMVLIAEENVVRLLKEFKDEGLIRTKGRKIYILDLPSIIKITNYED